MIIQEQSNIDSEGKRHCPGLSYDQGVHQQGMSSSGQSSQNWHQQQLLDPTITNINNNSIPNSYISYVGYVKKHQFTFLFYMSSKYQFIYITGTAEVVFLTPTVIIFMVSRHSRTSTPSCKNKMSNHLLTQMPDLFHHFQNLVN